MECVNRAERIRRRGWLEMERHRNVAAQQRLQALSTEAHLIRDVE